MADFDKECFFIAPIGDEDSDIRKRSDAVKDWIVTPAAAAHELETVRGDDVGEPGQITSQAVQHCLSAKAAVADLTGGNPNVYYELSVRHGAQLPVVLIAERGTKLPFDMAQSRVIFFDHTDLADAGKAKIDLEEQIGESLTAPPNNPIADGMRLAELKGGNTEEKTLANLVEQVSRISAVVERLDARGQGDDLGKLAELALLHRQQTPEDPLILKGGLLDIWQPKREEVFINPEILDALRRVRTEAAERQDDADPEEPPKSGE